MKLCYDINSGAKIFHYVVILMKVYKILFAKFTHIIDIKTIFKKQLIYFIYQDSEMYI